jgi:hypothetical protein
VDASNLNRTCCAAVLVLLGVSNAPRPTVAQRSPRMNYQLSIAVSETGPCSCDVAVGSNVPGIVEVIVALELVGLKGEDAGIGLQQNLKLATGVTGVVHFDGQKDQNPMLPDQKALSDGSYVAEVTLYPNWGLIDGPAKGSRLDRELTSKTKAVVMRCGGTSAASVKKRVADRGWVMRTVYTGLPWKRAVWTRRLGEYRQEPYREGSWNSRTTAAYYFPSVDMTLLVNTQKQEVLTFHEGRSETN